MPRCFLLSAILVSSALLAACADQPLDARSGSGPTLRSSVVSAEDEFPDEAPLRALAAEIPGFGGLYLNSSGETVVYLTRSGAEGQARPVVDRWMRRYGPRGRRVPAVAFRTGAYDFRQLAQWRGAILPDVFGIRGVQSVDLDEAANRLRIGIVSEGAQEPVRGLLSRRGVPEDAALIAVEDSITGLEDAGSVDLLHNPGTIQGHFDAIPGGVQITYVRSYSPQLLQNRCTVAVPVRRNGERMLLTASHCTRTSWINEATPIHQPYSDDYGSWRAGVEAIDPPGVDCGFMRCRYADAALVRTDPGRPDHFGHIARTQFSASSVYPDTMGSLDIDPNNPFFVVSGTASAVAGMRAYKMGRRTGWTYGRVEETCVLVSGGSNRLYRCQLKTRVWVAPGDSGGPLFAINADGTVSLLGVVSTRTGNGSFSYHSPMAGVFRDLGTFQVSPTDGPPPPSEDEEPPVEEGGCPPPQLVC